MWGLELDAGGAEAVAELLLGVVERGLDLATRLDGPLEAARAFDGKGAVPTAAFSLRANGRLETGSTRAGSMKCSRRGGGIR